MSDGGLLSLKWNNHSLNFKQTLSQLLENGNFSDATIACGGTFFPTHKFVLSTCSDYFTEMFERTPCKHPVIVLRDVNIRDVEFLLHYMYGGEVSVSQSDLTSLIRTAEMLKIKGLATPDEAEPVFSSEDINHSCKRPNNTCSEEEVDGEKSTRKKAKCESAVNPSSLRNSVKTESSVCSTEGESNSIEKREPRMGSNDSFVKVSNLQQDVPVIKQEEDVIPIEDTLNSASGTDQGGLNPSGPADLSDSSWTSLYASSENNAGSGLPSDHFSSSDLCASLYTSIGAKEDVSGPAAYSRNTSMLPSSPSSTSVRKYSSSDLSNFVCQYPGCNYVTHSKSWMDIHFRKHTGVKPFECPYCEFRSAQRGNLNVHIRKLHSQRLSQSTSHSRSWSNDEALPMEQLHTDVGSSTTLA